MNTIIVIMMWEISLALAFFAGFTYKGKKRPTKNEKPLTEQEKRHLERVQREQENFMTYDGTPQPDIDAKMR